MCASQRHAALTTLKSLTRATEYHKLFREDDIKLVKQVLDLVMKEEKSGYLVWLIENVLDHSPVFLQRSLNPQSIFPVIAHKWLLRYQIEEQIRTGAKQVIVQGAGLDPYPLLFASLFKKVEFIEIAEPGLQQIKFTAMAMTPFEHGITVHSNERDHFNINNNYKFVKLAGLNLIAKPQKTFIVDERYHQHAEQLQKMLVSLGNAWYEGDEVLCLIDPNCANLFATTQQLGFSIEAKLFADDLAAQFGPKSTGVPTCYIILRKNPLALLSEFDKPQQLTDIPDITLDVREPVSRKTRFYQYMDH